MGDWGTAVTARPFLVFCPSAPDPRPLFPAPDPRPFFPALGPRHFFIAPAPAAGTIRPVGVWGAHPLAEANDPALAGGTVEYLRCAYRGMEAAPEAVYPAIAGRPLALFCRACFSPQRPRCHARSWGGAAPARPPPGRPPRATLGRLLGAEETMPQTDPRQEMRWMSPGIGLVALTADRERRQDGKPLFGMKFPAHARETQPRPSPTGLTDKHRATRRSDMMGRCFFPPWNVTASCRRTPGLPLMRTCGPRSA